MKQSIKGLHHIVMLVAFLIISMAYYSPLLEGKKVHAHDDIAYIGISKEIRDFREKNGTEPLWTNSLFGGMPAYQVSRVYKGNVFETISKKVLKLPKPALYLFMTLCGFYLTLLLFRVDWRISAVGAIAFAFSSYFLVIIAAGHNAKAAAIAYMAPMIGGLFYTYRIRIIPGLIIFAISFGLQLVTNHLQITYYTLLMILAMTAYLLYEDIKNKKLPDFLKKSSFIILVSFLVILTNSPNLYFTYDYAKDSTRGVPEITLTDKENATSGLDKDYALTWSYGVDETMTVLIPNFKGGTSAGELPQDSETYRLFERAQGPAYAKKVIKQIPLYWGTQPSTSGPVYLGALVMFLFVLGLFTYRDKFKWWMIIVTVLAVLLAWGKNFEWFSHLFLDYFPGYNKFRTVTMILVIVELTIPLIAFLGLNEVLRGNIENPKLLKYLKNSLIIVGGICLLFALFPSMFYSFESPNDFRYVQQGSSELVDAFQADRLMLFRKDAFRSLFFILLGAGLLFLFIKRKIQPGTFIIILGVAILVDLWAVDKRYMNNDYFVRKKEIKEPIKATQADLYILKDTDPDYRVLNIAVSTFQEATTSFFHKSLGGYHAAKMKRYQNLIDYELSKNITELAKSFQNPTTVDSTLSTLNGLNMLNTKYIIYNPEQAPLFNPHRFGEAWIVDTVKYVENADQELLAIMNEDIVKAAIVNINDKESIPELKIDSNASIELSSYEANHLSYAFRSSEDAFVVFSEIYYNKGWNAYVDGELTKHLRANFLLRAMMIPKGDHKVEFKFEPKMYTRANSVSRISSIILILLIAGGTIIERRKRNSTTGLEV